MIEMRCTRIRARAARLLVILAAMALGTSGAYSEAPPARTATLTVTWTLTVRPNAASANASLPNIVDVWQNLDGRLSALVWTDKGTSLATDITEAPTVLTSLLSRRLRTAGVSNPDGSVWVIGTDYVGKRGALKTIVLEKPIIARFATSGAILSKTQEEPGRSVNGGVRTMSGDLVVAGEQYETNPDQSAIWLKNVSTAGGVKWSRDFPNKEVSYSRQHNLSVALLDGGKIALIATERESPYQDPDHSQHVRLWIVDKSGALITNVRVRDKLNRKHGSPPTLDILADTSIFVMSQGGFGYAEIKSGFPHTLAGAPLEIASFDASGTIRWRTVLKPANESDTRNLCAPKMSRDQSGDLLVSCAFDGKLSLFRVDHDTGAFKHVVAALPDCASRYARTVFVFGERDEITLIGALPRNVGLQPGEESCNWRGTINRRSFE